MFPSGHCTDNGARGGGRGGSEKISYTGGVVEVGRAGQSLIAQM